MKVLAIYAINEHLAQLMVEAQRARLAREARYGVRPSLFARLVAAIRSAARRTDASPALA